MILASIKCLVNSPSITWNLRTLEHNEVQVIYDRIGREPVQLARKEALSNLLCDSIADLL